MPLRQQCYEIRSTWISFHPFTFRDKQTDTFWQMFLEANDIYPRAVLMIWSQSAEFRNWNTYEFINKPLLLIYVNLLCYCSVFEIWQWIVTTRICWFCIWNNYWKSILISYTNKYAYKIANNNIVSEIYKTELYC